LLLTGFARFLIHALKVEMDFVQENNQNHDGLSCCAGATEAVLHVQPAITAKAKDPTFDQQGIQVICF
jgi:hypothetical protein